MKQFVGAGRGARVGAQVAAGADPNWIDAKDDTPLGLAAKYGAPGAVRALVENVRGARCAGQGAGCGALGDLRRRPDTGKDGGGSSVGSQAAARGESQSRCGTCRCSTC